MDELEHIFAPGHIIDEKYRIDKPVGAGGMGGVYAATHIVLNRKVAVKLLHPRFSADHRAVKRFQQEAEIAASLGHDNICEVTDIGALENGAPYLVMPLLKGKPLSALLKNGRRLSAPRACDIVIQTLSALSAAHHEHIVHRDLKPDNIYICRVGDRDDFVKLLDFGISKVLNKTSCLELTRSGTVLGTPFYMAPEQAGGSRQIDARCDIYAVGVILYQTLTGCRPFDGTSYNEVVANILMSPFLAPRTVAPDIPAALERVILKAMARDPAARFASADAMQAALQDALSLENGNLPADTADICITEADVAAKQAPLGNGLSDAAATRDGTRPGRIRRSRKARKRQWGILAILFLVLTASALIWWGVNPQGMSSGALVPDTATGENLPQPTLEMSPSVSVSPPQTWNEPPFRSTLEDDVPETESIETRPSRRSQKTTTEATVKTPARRSAAGTATLEQKRPRPQQRRQVVVPSRGESSPATDEDTPDGDERKDSLKRVYR